MPVYRNLWEKIRKDMPKKGIAPRGHEHCRQAQPTWRLHLHDGNLYIGFTTDLQRRLTEHFHGESKATAPRRPFRLIFCEYFFSKEDAQRREGYLKTTTGRRGLKLILRETLKSPVWD